MTPCREYCFLIEQSTHNDIWTLGSVSCDVWHMSAIGQPVPGARISQDISVFPHPFVSTASRTYQRPYICRCMQPWMCGWTSKTGKLGIQHKPSLCFLFIGPTYSFLRSRHTRVSCAPCRNKSSPLHVEAYLAQYVMFIIFADPMSSAERWHHFVAFMKHELNDWHKNIISNCTYT